MTGLGIVEDHAGGELIVAVGGCIRCFDWRPVSMPIAPVVAQLGEAQLEVLFRRPGGLAALRAMLVSLLSVR